MLIQSITAMMIIYNSYDFLFINQAIIFLHIVLTSLGERIEMKSS